MSENALLGKVSIVVPVYNAEKSLKDCVESIINQTYGNWELWLVDDGSRDCSGQICDEYEMADARIRAVHKRNEGVSIARNTGLERATGEYVIFVDSDDYLEADALEKAVDVIHKSKTDVVMFGFYYHYAESGECVQNILSETFVGNTEEFVSEMFGEMFGKELLNPPWNKLVKRELLIQNKVFFESDFSICEDMIFTIGILEKCSKIAFLNLPLYHYIYKKEDNLVNKFHANYFEALSFYINKTKKYLSKYVASGEEQLIDAFFVNQTIAYLKKIYVSSGYAKEKKYSELKRICETPEFYKLMDSYVPKSKKKKVVVWCIKHRWFCILHFLYSKYSG